MIGLQLLQRPVILCPPAAMDPPPVAMTAALTSCDLVDLLGRQWWATATTTGYSDYDSRWYLPAGPDGPPAGGGVGRPGVLRLRGVSGTAMISYSDYDGW